MTDISNRDEERRSTESTPLGETRYRDDAERDRLDPMDGDRDLAGSDLDRDIRPAGSDVFREDRSAVGLGSREPASAGLESDRAPLFPGEDSDRFRDRWMQIQTNFVDEPRHAVEQADELVSEVTDRLTSIFSRNRDELERQWTAGDEVSTEDLRRSLQRYRSFFERLLSM